MHLANNEISRSEIRHCQVFHPTKRVGRAATSLYVPTPSNNAPGSTPSITDPQSPSTFFNKNITMSFLNSPDSSQMDLYDQDKYSIPDDELRSVDSSTQSSDGEDGNTSMTEETDRHKKPMAYNPNDALPPKSVETERSNPSGWTTLTSRKHQAATKKHKPMETPSPFDPRLSDRELPHLGGRTMGEIQDALAQNKTDIVRSKSTKMNNPSDMSPPASPRPSEQEDYSIPDDDLRSTTSTTSSYRARVPLTTVEPEVYARPQDKRLKVPTKICLDDQRQQDEQIKKKSKVALQPTPKFGHQNITTTDIVGYNQSPTPQADSIQQQSQPTLPSGPTNYDSKNTYYTYRAQLTFGLKPTKSGVNVADLFNKWLENSCTHLGNFSLLPFDEDKGQQIMSLSQVPEDNASFYTKYFFNHRVLNHGNLTGMVYFQCSVPWTQVKSAKSSYFQWLKEHNVYLNQTKFKTATLVACGFLVGAHPGYLRRDEAEEELTRSLESTKDEVQFQLTARTISVPIQEGKPERYTFQAVVVETATSTAAKLREKFFSLGNPLEAKLNYPYTGHYQFVPFLHTKEWTVPKILRLAKLHVSIVQDLKPIFLGNLKNIHNTIDNDGTTLLQGFYGMSYSTLSSNTAPARTVPLLHSVHNTGSKTTKTALVSQALFQEALNQLSTLHDILSNNIPESFHGNVFIDSARATIIGRSADTISSCNYALYATQLLENFNPQEG